MATVFQLQEALKKADASLPFLVFGPIISGRSQIIGDYLKTILKSSDIFWSWDGLMSNVSAIENFREERERFYQRALLGEQRAIFLDNIDCASLGAINLLLKFLEEPPSQTLIVLTAYALKSVPATISSRCFQYTVLPDAALIQTEPATFGYFGLKNFLEKLGPAQDFLNFKNIIKETPWRRWAILNETLAETIKQLLATEDKDEDGKRVARQEIIMLIEWWLVELSAKVWGEDFEKYQKLANQLIAARERLALEKPKTVLESLCYNL